MSADWISVDVDLSDKPEVRSIARALRLDRDFVVGKLVRVWGWFDRVSVDGVVDGVDADIDDLAKHDGFAHAMIAVGWLVVDHIQHSISIPGFDSHHGNSAKKRLLKSARQRRWRSRTAKLNVDTDVVQVPSTNVDAHASTHASTTEQNNKRKEGESERARSSEPRPPESVSLEKWDAYREQLDHDGKSSVPRVLTAIGQLRVLEANGVDCNAVLDAAVMRGHRDLSDVARQLAAGDKQVSKQTQAPFAATSKTRGAVQKLEEIKHELAESGNSDWPAKIALPAS